MGSKLSRNKSEYHFIVRDGVVKLQQATGWVRSEFNPTQRRADSA